MAIYPFEFVWRSNAFMGMHVPKANGSITLNDQIAEIHFDVTTQIRLALRNLTNAGIALDGYERSKLSEAQKDLLFDKRELNGEPMPYVLQRDTFYAEAFISSLARARNALQRSTTRM